MKGLSPLMRTIQDHWKWTRVSRSLERTLWVCPWKEGIERDEASETRGLSMLLCEVARTRGNGREESRVRLQERRGFPRRGWIAFFGKRLESMRASTAIPPGFFCVMMREIFGPDAKGFCRFRSRVCMLYRWGMRERIRVVLAHVGWRAFL